MRKLTVQNLIYELNTALSEINQLDQCLLKHFKDRFAVDLHFPAL
jgi:hypothetical protein